MIETIEKNFEWINHLDFLYSTNIIYRNNPSFYFYPDIKINVESENINIIYRKKANKTQILFGDGYGRRTYLSDVDIINIIVHSEDNIYNVICEILKLYISDQLTKEVEFQIGGERFYYNSIIREDYEKDKIDILRFNSFVTTADLHIKYIDLITLISLIINKEFLVDVLRGNDRVLRQSKKFFILSEFYKKGNYSGKLEELNYDTSKKIEEVYYKSTIAKKTDKIFEDITL
ncbi:hypothetical protein P8850_14975 [Bacillus inaquosorum]|uniref:hypothetical protein n=1 Tax=Bacillus inaquosorum TaxID=483913 RepID=UPI00227E19D5|nr:hypothetical protein [Bacillus inaquosorum]MCY8725158.1 hypothetical protein [Bacillus inaquosorum]MEC0639098.1 hypothetical protein [Bacillus inaquosorum]